MYFNLYLPWFIPYFLFYRNEDYKQFFSHTASHFYFSVVNICFRKLKSPGYLTCFSKNPENVLEFDVKKECSPCIYYK